MIFSKQADSSNGPSFENYDLEDEELDVLSGEYINVEETIEDNSVP
jgi:hypothetical protein